MRFSLNQSCPNSFPKGANSDNVKTPGVQLFHHIVLLMYFFVTFFLVLSAQCSTVNNSQFHFWSLTINNGDSGTSMCNWNDWFHVYCCIKHQYENVNDHTSYTDSYFKTFFCFVLLLLAVEATFKFTYVEKYPDEPPLWELQSQENLEDVDVEAILSLLQQQVCLTDSCLLLSSSLV